MQGNLGLAAENCRDYLISIRVTLKPPIMCHIIESSPFTRFKVLGQRLLWSCHVLSLGLREEACGKGHLLQSLKGTEGHFSLQLHQNTDNNEREKNQEKDNGHQVIRGTINTPTSEKTNFPHLKMSQSRRTC